MLHHIQKNILNSLATADMARYSDIKPGDMDGNIFTYHLKQLIADKYITKQDDGSYALLPHGKNYIVHRYENPLLQAHSIFLIALRRDDQWLLRERLVQPLIGMAGFIHGEPIASESVVTTAERRLFDKTGIKASLQIHNSGLIRIESNGMTESFSHALILVGDTSEDISITHDVTGRNFWLPTTALQQPHILPSCSGIIQRIGDKNISPFELDYQLPDHDALK